MTQATKTAVLAVLKTDATITDEERARIEAALAGGEAATLPAIISRQAAAKWVGRTPHRLDQLARAGKLRRVRLGDSSRAIGFTVESLKQLMGVSA